MGLAGSGFPDCMPMARNYDSSVIVTSYYQSKLLAASGLAVIQISNGRPRWGKQPVAKLELLYPPRAVMEAARAGATMAKLTRLYREHLDRVGAAAIAHALRKLEQEHGSIALCCFEGPGKMCHRHLFAQWWAEQTRIVIAELAADDVPGKAAVLPLVDAPMP